MVAHHCYEHPSSLLSRCVGPDTSATLQAEQLQAFSALGPPFCRGHTWHQPRATHASSCGALQSRSAWPRSRATSRQPGAWPGTTRAPSWPAAAWTSLCASGTPRPARPAKSSGVHGQQASPSCPGGPAPSQPHCLHAPGCHTVSSLIHAMRKKSVACRCAHRAVNNTSSPMGHASHGAWSGKQHIHDTCTGKDPHQHVQASLPGRCTGHLWDSWRRGHTDSVNGVCWQPFSGNVCSASADNSVCVWDARSGLPILKLYGHESTCNHAAFDPQASLQNVLPSPWPMGAKHVKALPASG